MARKITDLGTLLGLGQLGAGGPGLGANAGAAIGAGGLGARAGARAPLSSRARQRKAFLDMLALPDNPGYDAGDQARAYAAAGAPKINMGFAQGVANADPATTGFVNQHNLADYLRLSGASPDDPTAQQIGQGAPTAVAALAELRKRMGV
jgi:hypothetical protein